MQTRALAAAAILALAGTAAIAADLPGSVAAAPPPPWPRTWDWNGFYGGINAGYSFGNAHNTWNIPTVLVTGVDAETFNGPLGGIQAGWNWQYSAFLAGIEADLDYGAETGKQTFNSAFTVTTTRLVTGTISVPHSYTLTWISTVRGRLGLAFNRALLYGTGGFAWAADKEPLSATATVSGSTAAFVNPQGLTAIRVGWTAGGGAELAINNNWTVRAEYLYVDLGTKSRGFATQGVPDPLAPTTTLILPSTGTISTRTTDNIARLGINYKFTPF
jgi:outer membrane immunogenic protein